LKQRIVREEKMQHLRDAAEAEVADNLGEN
jgi:hypothetical protein